MKKKVLFVMPGLYSGGAEKSLVNLLNLLDYSKLDVDLLLFKKEGLFMNQVPSEVNILNIPISLKYSYSPLDVDALKASKNQKDDITAALKTLAEAEDSKMLFGEPKPESIGSGNPIGAVTKTGSQDSDAAMRAAMGLPPVAEQK